MNASELVTVVRRTAQLSPNDPNYTDSLILEELTHALIDKFADPIKGLRQGHWKHYVIRTTAAGDPFVLIPHRAITQGLELVEISGDGGLSYSPLTILTDTQAQDQNNRGPGQPSMYWLEASGLHLVPTPDAAYRVRMRYLLRPPRLIPFISPSPIVLSVSPETYQITVNTDPSILVPINGFADLQRPNGSHELSWADCQVRAYAGVDPGPFTVTFDTGGTDLSKVSTGDLFTAAHTVKYPMLPQELHRALCDYTGSMILLSKGDTDKAQMLSQKSEAEIKRAVDMMQPRVGNAPFLFINKNSYLRRNIPGW